MSLTEKQMKIKSLRREKGQMSWETTVPIEADETKELEERQEPDETEELDEIEIDREADKTEELEDLEEVR